VLLKYDSPSGGEGEMTSRASFQALPGRKEKKKEVLKITVSSFFFPRKEGRKKKKGGRK